MDQLSTAGGNPAVLLVDPNNYCLVHTTERI